MYIYFLIDDIDDDLCFERDDEDFLFDKLCCLLCKSFILFFKFSISSFFDTNSSSNFFLSFSYFVYIILKYLNNIFDISLHFFKYKN